MRLSYFTRLFCLLAVLSVAFSSCQKEAELTPSFDPIQTLTTGSWRLDEIRENNQVISAGTGIKDRFSLTFRADGTYTENQFVNGTTYTGTWMLMNNDAVLHFTDHKGENHQYNLVSISDTGLQYGWLNKDNQQEVYTFSAQP
ncbi:lipocalin family protein [Hymenobacter puniceus]|uniref:lipocalin family protein n=1 Tax=Hymenobacter sp. BT190 TaxID=2763505 RepID=UPI001650E0AD|nr:lipocalin family protein [Hymenobacter sp. BT190]MBC6698017.1 lipocalin family protein [Hymenobacter sp. BT190]